MVSSSGPVRIGIIPNKSSYFAGEPLELIITVENTRQPFPQPPPASTTPPRTHIHKRASHSISSAQIYRPPTSPGPAILTSKHGLQTELSSSFTMQRKGLVGSKHKSRSHSVDISQTHESLDTFTKHSSSSANNSDAESAFYRSENRNASIHASHPHARKASVGQILQPLPSTSAGNYPLQSSFTASLDSIAELGGTDDSSKRTPFLSETHIQLSRQQYSNQVRRSSLPSLGTQPQRTTSDCRVITDTSIAPGSEYLVYGYAHLQGTLTLDKSIGLHQLQKELRVSRAFGGGSFDVMDLAPSATLASSRMNMQYAPGSYSSLRSRSIDAEGGRIPVFEFQSEPLFVDLVLAPQEHRCCESHS